MNNRMKLGMLLVIALLVTGACSKEPKQTQPVISKTNSGTSTAPPAKEAQQRDQALVRVINAAPGANAIDVFADDQKVFESVSFKSVTPYKELSDNRHTFRVRQAGKDSDQPIAENSEGLSGGRHYTILVMPGTNDKTTVSVLSDNITGTSPDKAEVRVIHASPDAGEVDVVDKSGNKKLFSGVNFERETNYMALDPTKTTLEVRPEGQDKAVLTVPNANFEKGKYYTIVVTGTQKGTPKLQALMIEDQLGGAPPTASNEKPSQNPKMVKAKATKY
ncbi:MAG TPA: DUF4397 domain-containing protein [Pyrinomonadaceae bacterium]|nr:DUF4397 domain-containing protein [Pyrinomonadaceae bacterium]